MQKPLLLTTLILLALTAGLTPATTAQNAEDWTVRIIPSSGQSANGIVSDVDGETLGVLFEGNDNNVYFALEQTQGGAFAIQNSDVTGTVNLGNRDMVNYGTDRWIVCGKQDSPTLINCWRSTDDGANWVIGTDLTGFCTGAAQIADLVHIQGSEIALICNTNLGDLFFAYSGDAGVTWEVEDISDNQGDPTDAGTDSVVVAGTGTSGMIYSPAGFTVRFVRGTQLDLFEIGSQDSVFWTVPFTSEAGNTPDPLANPCDSLDYNRVLGQYKGSGEYWAATTTPSPNYVCANGVPIPQDPGTFSIAVGTIAPSQWLSCNLTGQCLIGFADLTANENYVWYDRDGAAPVLAYTNSADTTEFSLAQTPTRGAFFYSNNDFGGRLEVATASVFPTGTGAQSSWCSNPFSVDFEGDPAADFGYNYVEGVTFETDPSPDSGTGVTVATADGYRFESTSDNYDYLGKGWTTETYHVKSVFRIEALTEGRATDFRSIFSFETDTPSSTSKGTGSTSGDTSGSFATHIGVRFRESGNDWLVQVEFNNDLLDDGSPVDLGSAAVTGDPNNPTTYSLEINTTAPGYVAVKNEAGNDIRNFTIQGNANTQFAALVNQPLWSQWFVSGGSNSLLNSVTYLDDNLDSGDTDDSTCIFFLDVGEVEITGDPGTAPGSEIPDDPTPTPTVAPGFDDLSEDFGNVFGGIGAEGGAIFLAIFWILVFAAGAYGILGGSPLAIGIGALCGFIFSIFTGLIPDILVFIVVLLAGAAVGMRLFGGGGSGADG